MARAGLGSSWSCAFANDFCSMKASVYRANWGDDLVCADINSLRSTDIPSGADLAWASFPCQDLSLAGNALGIGTEQAQTRSGAFWAFWRLMMGQAARGTAPKLIVLENVYGSLTANNGRDFLTDSEIAEKRDPAAPAATAGRALLADRRPLCRGQELARDRGCDAGAFRAARALSPQPARIVRADSGGHARGLTPFRDGRHPSLMRVVH